MKNNFFKISKVLIFLFCYLTMTAYLLAQNGKRVNGHVIDVNNEPLIGVSILEIGTSNGTVTDINGSFNITVNSPNSVLKFSYMGFEEQEVRIENRNNIVITMNESTSTLDEVVVIGYGTMRKRDLTGSVAQVKMNDLAIAPVSSFTGALAGRVAGVQVSSSDGQPGQGVDIVIRGNNSLTQSNAPLYVVDGFELESQASMNAINTDDIASITILKDASATAIYGSRAANGVVLIETKRGNEGKPIVNYNMSYGIQATPKVMKMMDSYDFVRYQYELNPGQANLYYLEEKGKTLEDYRNEKTIDWQSLLFSKAPMQTHNLSVRGGTRDTKYAISSSIFDQEGIIINSGHKRYQGRISLDQRINKKLHGGISVNYSDITNNGAATVFGATGSSTSYTLYNTWGARPVLANSEIDLTEQVIDPELDSSIDLRVNPIVNAKNELVKNRIIDTNISSFLEYKILDDLTLRINGAYNTRKNRGDRFYNSNTTRGTPLNTSNSQGINGSVSFSESFYWSNSNFLTYNKIFKDIHHFNVMSGVTLQGGRIENYGYSSQQISNEELGMNGLAEGVLFNGISVNSSNKLSSFLMRLNYTYKSKYLFTFTGRSDGSSKFAPGNRWGFFPSGAFAWRILEEPFMKEFTTISDAKLRVSYGITGNNRVGDFSYLPSLNFQLANGYSFENAIPSRGVRTSDVGNRDLKWESTEQLDLGLDLGFFKNRITLNVDMYQKNTRDLLLWANLPRSTGFSRVFKNIGSVRNEGLEFTLNTVNIDKAKFNWQSTFNIGFNRNKVIALNEGENSLQSSVNWEYHFNASQLYIAKVGYPMASFYSYIFDGIYQFEDFDELQPGKYMLKPSVPTNGNDRGLIKPGDIKYKDINGDGVVNDFDRAIIGRTMPIHSGGFANTLGYNRLSLHLFLQWTYGNNILNANRLMLEGNALAHTLRNQFASYNNRWTPENPSNTLHRAGGAGPLGYYSSRVIEDGSFLRLKTVSISYSVPIKSSLKRMISDLSINVTAENLYTWTKYSGMDPEVSVRQTALTPGLDWAAYPRARTVVFGVNVSF